VPTAWIVASLALLAITEDERKMRHCERSEAIQTEFETCRSLGAFNAPA
jgi:hypothetical protein